MMTEQATDMRLSWTDDEIQLRTSVERFIQNEYDFERHLRVIDQRKGFDSDFWRQIAEMGLVGACLPESVGGYAQSANEALLILEQFGHGLVVEPLLSSVLAPAAAIIFCDEDQAHAGLLAEVIAGDKLLALAWVEPGRRYDVVPSDVHATRTDTGWRLDGRKSAVLSAPLASVLIVSAATAEGPTLFLVPRNSAGLGLTEYMMIDGQSAADLQFDQVAVESAAVLGSVGGGLGGLEAALDWGAAGACAEAIGAMEAALQLTIDYAQTRKQFGQAIGSFQVIQHRLAKMLMEQEYARSLMPLLSARLAAEPAVRTAAVSAIRAKVSAAARYVAADAVQLHGGIGVTHEAAISHYFRKLIALDLTWGDSRTHLARYRRRRTPGSDLLMI